MRSSVGRPSSLLRFAPSVQVVAAVDVTEYTARGRLVDLGGTTRHEESLTFDLADVDPGAARVNGLLRFVERLTSKETGVKSPVVAVGITVPGIVDRGVVSRAVELDWHELPLAEIVSSRCGLPVYVENDANATAFGEWTYGASTGAHNAVALVLGARISAGIINEGRLYRGDRSAAGEIGFLLTSTASFTRYFTEQGDIESSLAARVLPFAQLEESVRPGKRIGPAFRAMMALCGADDAEATQAREEFFDSIALAFVALFRGARARGHRARRGVRAVQRGVRERTYQAPRGPDPVGSPDCRERPRIRRSDHWRVSALTIERALVPRRTSRVMALTVESQLTDPK